MEAIKNVPGAPSPVGAYSPAVKCGGMLFCSGQIAIDPSSEEFVEGGIEAQTRQVLDNLSAVLETSGASFSSVVMTSIFLADMNDAKAVNELYGQYVNQDAPPARQTVAVRALPLGAMVEISLIAELG